MNEFDEETRPILEDILYIKNYGALSSATQKNLKSKHSAGISLNYATGSIIFFNKRNRFVELHVISESF